MIIILEFCVRFLTFPGSVIIISYPLLEINRKSFSWASILNEITITFSCFLVSCSMLHWTHNLVKVCCLMSYKKVKNEVVWKWVSRIGKKSLLAELFFSYPFQANNFPVISFNRKLKLKVKLIILIVKRTEQIIA